MIADLKILPFGYGFFSGKYQEDLIALYQEAFSRPPYFEAFTKKEVGEIMKDLLGEAGSNCLVAFSNDQLVGFCGGFRADRDEEVARSLGPADDIDSENTFYLAELAVKEEYCQFGCGTELVKALLDREYFRNAFSTIVTRTPAQNANALKIYERTGFVRLPDLTQKVKTWVSYNGTRKREVQERIFLARKL